MPPTPGDRRVHVGPARRRWPRRLLVATNIVVAVGLLGAVSAYGYVQWRLGQIHREKIAALTSINGGKPFTVLIVGSDSRSALAANDPGNQQFGSAAGTPGQRSDTIILARIAPATRQIEMMSIPRDLWVNIPGSGQNRINSAFDSGANLLVKTIQTDLGIPINHYIEVNFDTFQDISDAVGGVSFYFPTPAKDAYSLLNVPQAGCISLSGAQALAFVRARHYEYYQNGEWHFEAESDLARIQRQQTFIKKMLKKAEGEFTDPLALNNVIAGVTKNLTVDSGFSSSLLLNLAKDFHSIDPATIASITLPNYGYTTPGGADVLGLQQPQAAQTIAAFNSFGTGPAPSSGSTKTTTPKKTTPSITAPSVTVAPSSVSVEVANGSGMAGQAATLTSTLTAHGYHATTNLTSPGYTYKTTMVEYAPDSKTAAEQLAALIPGGATIQVTAALAPTAYNVEIITGSSYTSASGPASASSTSSTSTGPTTTVPGTNAATYVLPGMPAGQTPPSC
ncbi:MAG TPA: LCP family protein [Acidimicrobiales bacterium]|jgi:LCP family protein required for cell wall assembly|nr:LCP family protein [Acidimicrobiales bacterium]